MAWFDHYNMERKSLECALGIIEKRFIRGAEFGSNDYPANVDAILHKMYRTHDNLFKWVRDNGTKDMKEILDKALSDNFPTYKSNNNFYIDFDKCLAEVTDFTMNENLTLFSDYVKFLQEAERGDRLEKLPILIAYHNRIEKFHFDLQCLRNWLDCVSLHTFDQGLECDITRISNLEEWTENNPIEYQSFNLIVNTLPTLKGMRIPRVDDVVYGSLFSDWNTTLFRDQKIGFIYDYKFNNIISMEERDSYSNFLRCNFNSNDECLKVIADSLMLVQRIGLDNGIYWSSSACRILPIEFLKDNVFGYNEIIIDGNTRPSAIFAIEEYYSMEDLKAFSYTYDLPIVLFSKQSSNIRKLNLV